MWTVKLKGIPRCVSYQAVSINSEIYAFDFTNAVRNLIDVYIFNSVSHRWGLLKTPSPSGGRPMMSFSYTAAAYGKLAYVFGSWITRKTDRKLYSFDTNTMTWRCPEVCGDEPTTCFHTACVVGHRMYMIGNDQLQSPHRVHFLDLESFKWHRIHTSGDAPTCVSLHSTCTIGSRIYIWGGREERNFLEADNSFVFYLDTFTSTWVRTHVEGVAPECRTSHTAFVYKGEMYIFGGYSQQLRTLFADVHKYNPEKSCWTQVRPRRSGPCARMVSACCVIGDRVFVFGGYRPKATRAYQELVVHYLVVEEHLTDLHVLDFSPTLETLCLAAVADARLELGHLSPAIEDKISAMMDDDSS